MSLRKYEPKQLGHVALGRLESGAFGGTLDGLFGRGSDGPILALAISLVQANQGIRKGIDGDMLIDGILDGKRVVSTMRCDGDHISTQNGIVLVAPSEFPILGVEVHDLDLHLIPLCFGL